MHVPIKLVEIAIILLWELFVHFLGVLCEHLKALYFLCQLLLALLKLVLLKLQTFTHLAKLLERQVIFFLLFRHSLEVRAQFTALLVEGRNRFLRHGQFAIFILHLSLH